MESFETTYQTYYSNVFRLAQKMLNAPDVASDIAQDVFMDLYLYKGSQIQSAKSWLYRVTANKCIDHLKKNIAKRDVIKSETSIENNEEINLEKRSEIMQAAISRLNDNDRILLALYSEGISYKQIAEITEMNFNSVGKTLSRALNKLKKELKPHYHELFVG